MDGVIGSSERVDPLAEREDYVVISLREMVMRVGRRAIVLSKWMV
jgi:hypothetical protein